jgi:hypothetical protein
MTTLRFEMCGLLWANTGLWMPPQASTFNVQRLAFFQMSRDGSEHQVLSLQIVRLRKASSLQSLSVLRHKSLYPRKCSLPGEDGPSR